MTAGLLGATLLVTATTIDDAVWLIPHCASPTLPLPIRILHALLFVLTLECLAVLCVGVSLILEEAVLNSTSSKDDASIFLGALGALLCWGISIGLYIKKLLKRRRRQQQQETEKRNYVLTEETPLQSPLNISEEDEEQSHDEKDQDGEESTTSSQASASPWIIVTLTTLGALDEISYFPALIVSNVFSPWQLLWGTFLASIVILIIVLQFLAKFQPLVDFLDSIPLYGIVGMFAVVLSLGVWMDWTTSSHDTVV